MSSAEAREQWLASLVKAGPKLEGGPWFVFLQGRGLPTVELGPYENPAVAEEDARQVRRFLAAALSQAPQSA